MQHDFLPHDSPSPVASTESSLPPSPNFTPTADHPLYTPSLSSLSLDEELLPSDKVSPGTESESELEPESESVTQTQIQDLDALSDISELSSPSTILHPAADDTSVEDEPSRHVDYLAHEWKEEDIWASWRYVTARRGDYSNGVRLENASWRTWAKAKNNLGTISPETLNWLKDCDVTWLYGPLKTSFPPPSRLETPNSYEPKPILKKKTASEAILQRSLSQHTLLQHAGAILKAQEANGWSRPPFPRSNTDLDQIHHRTGSSTYSLGGTLTTSSSGMTSPSERRHIHFNDEVEQCIAVDVKESDEGWPAVDDESSSDDGVVMMREISGQASLSNRSTPRNSFSSDSKIIAPLPSTTLKYRGDTPEPRESMSILDRWSSLPSSQPSTSTSNSTKLSPTPSVETLRPPHSQSSANFLLDDDDEDPSLDFTGHYRTQDQPWFVPDEDEMTNRPLRLTTSGMFMPYGGGGGR
ncbi:hypothetical protein N7533_011541 [Penicillium manginii]|uniref:uncharacterized protein n=1 Tax=Penicillium manginii TaxID=203109 RepID=UPI002546CF40|nr:uncharacterized protein N7533_011541 [Penicillium manginii]KAJ5742132.1 hypothetical protein N7533_011541 [Penicillium manginii]